MKIKRKNDFIPAPAGTYVAVCSDWEEMMDQPDRYHPGKTVDMIRIYWQINKIMPGTQQNFLVQRTFTANLGPKTNFAKTLTAWLGRPISKEEEDNGFDPETLVGLACLLSIVHSTSDDGTVWANVESVLALPEGTNAFKPAGYTRKRDRSEAA